MGTRDYTSLPKDPVPVGWHASGFARRRYNDREAREEPTKTDHGRPSREASERVTSGEVRGVFGTHPERSQERIRRSDLGRSGTPRANEEKEMRVVVKTEAGCPAKVFIYLKKKQCL